MLPTKVLLALSGLLLTHAYKIEIDVKDDSVARAEDQIPVVNGEPSFNVTVDGPETVLLPQPACPGTCAGAATCKSGDGSIRIASDGSPFYLSCSKGIYNNNYATNEVTEPSFEACIDNCAKTVYCMAANYQASTKKCWRLAWYNYPGGANTAWEAAYKMSNTRQLSTTCPGSDGKVIRTKFRTYKVYCGYNIPTDEIRRVTYGSAESCAEECDTEIGCNAVVRDYSGNQCYLKSKYAVPPAKPNVASKDFMIMVPITGASQKPCCAETKDKSVLETGSYYDEL